jgi:hypothetical protein
MWQKACGAVGEGIRRVGRDLDGELDLRSLLAGLKAAQPGVEMEAQEVVLALMMDPEQEARWAGVFEEAATSLGEKLLVWQFYDEVCGVVETRNRQLRGAAVVKGDRPDGWPSASSRDEGATVEAANGNAEGLLRDAKAGLERRCFARGIQLLDYLSVATRVAEPGSVGAAGRALPGLVLA